MSHRQFVKDTLIESLKDYNLKGLTGIELGANSSRELQEFFEDLGVSEWKLTDLKDTPPVPMENIPYDDGSYDIVFSCHAFEHCENPLKALKEMKRIARKYIIIAMPYHCEHHILQADTDHIFCLTDIQMMRLLKYIDLNKHLVYIDKNQPQEQNWNLITIIEVENE